jgi:serine-type D-Ala-D-Ala carboxypeptidase (penicillin-binding protein 5/6)
MTRPFARLFFYLPVMAAMMMVPACGDPEKEAKLRWREEEVNAKEADLVRREKALAEERRAIDAAEAMVKQAQQEADKKNAQLAVEIEKTKKVRIELQTRQLRGPVPQVTAERVLVLDPQSDEILWEKNPDKRGPIASTQKLLTALLVLEAGDLDKEITIELSDTQCAPVRIGLKPGEVYTRRSLVTALLVKSSNDIAQALARDVAGSVEAFAHKMNERAAQLGARDSFFVNPHGLPSEPEQYSTARDLSLIAKAADKMPDIRAMVKLRSYNFEMGDKKKTLLENTNRVLRSYAYCDGMKTGFTSAAGYCLVASGEKNGKRRIVIVLNGTSNGVWKDAQALLEWAVRA